MDKSRSASSTRGGGGRRKDHMLSLSYGQVVRTSVGLVLLLHDTVGSWYAMTL